MRPLFPCLFVETANKSGTYGAMVPMAAQRTRTKKTSTEYIFLNVFLAKCEESCSKGQKM